MKTNVYHSPSLGVSFLLWSTQEHNELICASGQHCHLLDGMHVIPSKAPAIDYTWGDHSAHFLMETTVFGHRLPSPSHPHTIYHTQSKKHSSWTKKDAEVLFKIFRVQFFTLLTQEFLEEASGIHDSEYFVSDRKTFCSWIFSSSFRELWLEQVTFIAQILQEERKERTQQALAESDGSQGSWQHRCHKKPFQILYTKTQLCAGKENRCTRIKGWWNVEINALPLPHTTLQCCHETS